MALYDYQCINGHVHEHVFPMSEKPDTTACPTCGKSARSIITAPVIQGWDGDYFDENMVPSGSTEKGTVVTSRRQRDRLMKEYNLCVREPSDRARERREHRRRNPITVSG